MPAPVDPGRNPKGAAVPPASSVSKARGAAVPILSVNNVEVVYDHVILVLKGVSLAVPRGEIVALLGANGAGKSTTLKAISNLLSAERGVVTKGSIVFDGEEVHARSPNELVRRGCIQVMEGRRCFAHLSVEENLLTGAFTRPDGSAAIRRDLDLPIDPAEEDAVLDSQRLARGQQLLLAAFAQHLDELGVPIEMVLD